jgi:tetratricopeptide (TPR) repeat protein
MTEMPLLLRSLMALALVVGCASQPPPPEPSPLRRDAEAAVEAGSTRFGNRHFDASARSFGRAAEIYGALDDAPSEAAALRNQAEALRRAGDVADARNGFERALALDRTGASPAAQARDLAGLARCSSAQGEADRAISEAKQAYALAARDPALRAALEVDLAVYLLARGSAADGERALPLLASAGAPENEPRIRAAAHLTLGRAQRSRGELDSAEAPLRLALDEFRELDDPEGLARTHEELGRLFQARGDAKAARHHLEKARRGYEFLGNEPARESLEDLLEEERG